MIKTEEFKYDITSIVKSYAHANQVNGITSHILAHLGDAPSTELYRSNALFLHAAQEIVNFKSTASSDFRLHHHLHSLCSSAWLYHEHSAIYPLPNIFDTSVNTLYVYALNNINIDPDLKRGCYHELIKNELGNQGTNIDTDEHAFSAAYAYLQEHNLIEPWLEAESACANYTDAYYDIFKKHIPAQALEAGISLNLTPIEIMQYAENFSGLEINSQPIDFIL